MQPVLAWSLGHSACETVRLSEFVSVTVCLYYTGATFEGAAFVKAFVVFFNKKPCKCRLGATLTPCCVFVFVSSFNEEGEKTLLKCF